MKNMTFAPLLVLVVLTLTLTLSVSPAFAGENGWKAGSARVTKVRSAEETRAAYGRTVVRHNDRQTQQRQPVNHSGQEPFRRPGVSPLPEDPDTIPGGSGRLSSSQARTLEFQREAQNLVDPETYDMARGLAQDERLNRESETATDIARSREVRGAQNDRRRHKLDVVDTVLKGVAIVGGIANERKAIEARADDRRAYNNRERLESAGDAIYDASRGIENVADAIADLRR